MTLDDFFTLTEIKDGLTSPSRVEELVSAMQKEQDSTVKNTGNASRQWGAVASIIAATKNRDCLDVFLQLDGVQYFLKWLKDAQWLSIDSVDSIVEDTIIAVLGAIENLQIQSEKFISSGIQSIVRNLIDHRSTRIQDIARLLFDSWKQNKISNHPQDDDENISSLQNHESGTNIMLVRLNSKAELPEVDLLHLRRCDKEEVHVAKVCEAEADAEVEAEAESLPFSNSQEIKSDQSEEFVPQASKSGLQSNMTLGCTSVENKTLARTPCKETEGTVQESSVVKDTGSMDTAATGTNNSCLHPKQSSVIGPSDASTSVKVVGDAKQVDQISDAVIESDKEIKADPVLLKIVDSSEESRFSSEPKSGKDDVGLANNCSKQVSTLTHQDSKCDSSPSSYGKESIDCGLGKPDKMPSYSDLGKHKVGKNCSKKKKRVDRKKSSLFSRSETSSRGRTMIGIGTSDIEFDYGIVDALEVATKVAQEVAREVDSRELSNSSGDQSGNSSELLASSDSTNGEHDNSSTESPTEEVPFSENNLPETPHADQHHIVSSNNLESEPEIGFNSDMVSSRVAETAEQVVNAEKGLCDFDLNQEVCVEDTENAASSISSPVPVVSATRPAAVSGLPSTPVQFEGALGWKGSASTSAFRPPSPRRTSGGRNGDNSAKQKQSFLGFDLNVADGIDDGDISITSRNQILVSSNSISAESSVETNSGKSERLKLDLNCRNDHADTHPPSNFKIFLSQGGHPSASPASSSSGQHSFKNINIDLNDGPHSSNQGKYLWGPANHSRGGIKSDKPVISLFGTKVEVNRQDLHSPSSSAKSLDRTMDNPYMGRTGDPLGLTPSMTYTHSPIYGYNGITSTPGTSFSSPMCVPASFFSPYMMDPRGATPVFPHVPGPPTYPQPPFVLNMVGGASGLIGSGPARPGFDLNSGFGFGFDIGNREPSTFRQFLLPAQIRPMEEYPRGNSQGSSSSMVSGKRKEPDSGWEPCTLNSRTQQPPWR